MMGFQWFSAQHSPIAVDFGSTSVKLLQTTSGDNPGVLAVAELPIPDELRLNQDQVLPYLESHLPGVLKAGGFKGRRVVCAVPSHQTIIQHMQIQMAEGMNRDDLVGGQLQMQMGLSPGAVVVRSHAVGEVMREGQNRTEVICLAIPRDVVMKYVELMSKCRMETVGVHTEVISMVRAFDVIHRRAGDENITTMYIELGWSGTRVAITHGTQIAFARSIQVGGQHFDRLIARKLKCSSYDARSRRLAIEDLCGTPTKPAAAPAASGEAAAGGAMARLAAAEAKVSRDEPVGRAGSPATTESDRRDGKAPPELQQSIDPAEGPTTAANLDYSELLDTITDELSMCLRYHQGVFPRREVDRIIVLGGEARQQWLCRHIARALRLPARLGDPLARLTRNGVSNATPGVQCDTPQPGWAVPCGLCASPTDM